MSGQPFRCKQFDVEQSDCAMKVGTDSMLLGALASHCSPKKILDIGTGTGLLALMLAQRYSDSQITAVEIEPKAASQAKQNFLQSKWADRVEALHVDFLNFESTTRYDLVVCNPPFFIDSLKNPDPCASIARHTNATFFEDLLDKVKTIMSINGLFWLVLPTPQSTSFSKRALEKGFNLHSQIMVQHSPNASVKREIIAFGLKPYPDIYQCLISIKETNNVYHPQYKELLKDFLTIFE